MTGSLFAPLPLSPMRPAAPSYSIDSFSEYSTRIVTRATCSPTSPTSGSRSARPKEEDEELFRDLFAGENEAETDDNAQTGCNSAVPTFLPQKPTTKRAPSTTNPRLTRPTPPQPVLSPPFIPRLKLEELVNARPDDDDEEEEKEDNNISRRASRRGSELEQVMEEDDSYSEEGTVDNGGKAAPRKTQVLNRDRGFNSTLGLTTNNQRSHNNDNLEQETLRFLERLDLKSVLYTPRPDLLSFYPSNATPPTSRSQVSPYSKTQRIFTKQPEDRSMENYHPEFEKVQVGLPSEKNDEVYKDPAKVPWVDGIASRLAYMESTYGTAPIVRKTRRETINRLANPISGHSSTLQALSPRQREKREAALTGRAPTSPISAAIAARCRRGPGSRTVKVPSLLGGKAEIPVPSLVASKRKATKRPDPLIHKRRTADSQHLTTDTRRKRKTVKGSRSLVARKEALKKKIQTRKETTKRGGERKIGGATFLTQRDDEEGVEVVEDFIARNRGVAQASLTFRSSRKATPRHSIPALPKRQATTARSRPRPPQARVGVPFARASGATKGTGRGRAAHTTRELESLANLKQKVPALHVNTSRSGTEHELLGLVQQPRRPQAWQARSSAAPSTRNLTGRPTTPGGTANPLRKLKVHPAIPTLLSRAPQPPPSAASTLLMGSLFSLTGAGSTSSRVPHQSSNRASGRKTDRGASRSTTKLTTFDAPTKVSAQRRRRSTTAIGNTTSSAPKFPSRLSIEEKPLAPLQTSGARRFTSKL